MTLFLIGMGFGFVLGANVGAILMAIWGGRR